MKNPKDMTTEELIEMADEIKRGMTTKVMKDIESFKKVDKMITKRTISKKRSYYDC